MVNGAGAGTGATGLSELFQLKDDYPPEFGRLAIGVPINADTYSIKLNSRAFYEGRLRDLNLLILEKGSTETNVWAGVSDSRWQYTSGWNVSASLGLNFGIVDFAAKFYAKQTKDECHRSADAAIVGVSTCTTGIDLLEDMSPDQYYRCATENFQSKLDAVKVAAENAEKSKCAADFTTLLSRLHDFYTTYGTGFVSGLDLVAYGVFEACLTKDSKAVQDLAKIGGGVAAAVPFVTGEAAGEYLSTHVDQDLETIFNAHSFGMPADSPPALWAAKAREDLNLQNIAKFLDGESWTQTAPAEVSEPKNPDITPKPIDLSSFDFPKLPEKIFGKAVDVLKRSILGLSGSAASPEVPTETSTTLPPAQSPAAVVDREKVLTGYAGYSQEKINSEATSDKTGFQTAQPVRELLGVNVSVDDEKRPAGDTSGSGADTSGADSISTPLDLGGYVPGGYRYLPWKKIFPQLEISPTLTESQVVFGQSLVWLSIRRMFEQYLEFCCHFQGVARNEFGEEIQIANEAAAFGLALDAVSEWLTEQLTNPDTKPILVTKSDRSFLQTLEDKLKDKLKRKFGFGMYEHYRFWIDNYEWLKQCAFGVVAVVEHDGHYLYQKSSYPACPLHFAGQLDGQPEGFTRVKHPPAAKDLLAANAYRLYPILSTTVEAKEGKPCFAWVGAPTRLTGDNTEEGLRRSGLLTLAYREPEHSPEGPEGKQPDDWERVPGRPPRLRDDSAVFDQTVVPMLIHQSPAGAEEFRSAENAAGFEGSNGRAGAEALQERWDNRKRMFGMHLYPGVGDDTGFGPSQERLKVAGTLAYEATAYATVMPKLPEKDNDDDVILWEVQGVCAAYSPGHQAMFFWGPEEGPGWKPGVFDPRLVRFVPVGYSAAEVAVTRALTEKGVGIRTDSRDPIPFTPKLVDDWMKAGGGPMWARPKTDLFDRLWELAGKEPESADY